MFSGPTWPAASLMIQTGGATCCRFASISRTQISPASSITRPTCAGANAGGRISCAFSATIIAALIDGSGGREPAAFVVRRMQLEFLKPARIDEILEVETRVEELGAAHLVLDQRIRRGDLGLFEAMVTVVLVSVSGKPLRLSTALRQVLGPGPSP